MGDATTLLALAERVERATGPDRWLADEVLFAAGWQTNMDSTELVEIAANDGWFVDCDESPTGREWVGRAEVMDNCCWYRPGSRPFRDNWQHGHCRPDPLASLDAAMSLVPEGFMWRLQAWPDGVNSALLEKNAGDFGAIDARHTETFTASPALALTAAALRARAAQITEDR